jgi:hypothetical protein
MKHKQSIILAFAILLFNTSFAQLPSKNIFEDSAQKYSIPINIVQALSTLQKDQKTILPFSNLIKLNLKINMNEWNDKNTHTIGAKLLDFDNSYMTISYTIRNNKLFITGDLISLERKTAFKIILKEDGNVYFEKTNIDQLIIQ